MTEIISVRFKDGGKSYYFNPNGMTVAVGDRVIIETSRGVEFGECVEGNRLIDEMELVSPLRPVLRMATDADFAAMEKNKEKEARAYQICQQKIQEHGLDMKLVEVEYNFDGSKILFFFTSEGRVDFRALVRDLAGIFHTRIELRQIGVRDEAKMLGGLGVCGRPYCCNSFLSDFHPVSIKMAKTQNLSLNPTKISGACGRLMCCLKYEQEAYEDVVKRTPKLESLVETPDGVGTVNAVQLLREKVKVKLDNDPENPQIYSTSDIKVIRSGKGKRPEGYELPEQPEQSAPRAPRLRNETTAAAAAETAPVQPSAAQEQKRSERPARAERPERPERPVRPEHSAKPAEPKGFKENVSPAAEGEEPEQGQKPRRPRHRPRKRPNAPGEKPQIQGQKPQTEGGAPKREGTYQNGAPKGDRPQGQRPKRHRPRKRPGGQPGQGDKPQNGGAPKTGE